MKNKDSLDLFEWLTILLLGHGFYGFARIMFFFTADDSKYMGSLIPFFLMLRNWELEKLRFVRKDVEKMRSSEGEHILEVTGKYNKITC